MDITPRGFEKESDKLTQEQLDSPVDVVVAEPPAESVPKEAVETESEEGKEPPKEEPVEVVKAAEPEPEEDKVPKSRFLTMHQRAVDAEKALRAFEAERASHPEVEIPLHDDEALKQHYIKIFGDTELTDNLYKAELARLNSIEDKVAERAYERLSKREEEEQKLIDERVQSFDTAFEELSITTGKDEFSDDEQVAILDIVEEYSPKDAKGNLIGDFLMPLDKAFEIYSLRTETTVKPKRNERNKVASIVGAKTDGAPTSGNDAEYVAGFQGRWRDKVK